MELPDSWRTVQKHLDGLPDTAAKTKYVLEVMTEIRHREIPATDYEAVN